MSSSVAQLRARSSAAASTSYRPTTMTPSVGLQRARAPICGGQNDPPRRPRRRRAPPACRCQDPSAPAAAAAAAPAPVVAVEGDVVRVHWSCRDAQSGAVLSCSRGGGAIVASAPRGDVTAGGNGGEDGKDGDGEDGDREPLTFEVGAGCAQNNPIFDAFDDAVRGLPLGGRAEVRAEGGPWDAARLFTVPRAHDEVARLEGRYKRCAVLCGHGWTGGRGRARA